MIVTKAAAIVSEDTETESPNGGFEVILSAPTTDRDGEVIDSRAFEPLPDHIPFDIDHGMTVQTTVGSGTPFYDDDGALRVKGTYASTALAQEVRTLVSEGHIRTTSVTFMAADREDEKGVVHVRTAELLNGTFTPIPSNREAVVLSSKALAATEKVGARNSAKDAEAIQAAHDATVSAGAACGKSHAGGSTKDATVGELLTREEWQALEAASKSDEDINTSDTEQSAEDAADTAAEAAESTADSTDEGAEDETAKSVDPSVLAFFKSLAD